MANQSDRDGQEERSDERANSVVRAIMFRLNILTATTVVLLLALVGIAIYGYIVASQNHDALCTFQDELQARVEQTKSFVDDPNLAPEFSDPKTVALIQAQLKTQEAELNSLSGLSC